MRRLTLAANKNPNVIAALFSEDAGTRRQSR